MWRCWGAAGVGAVQRRCIHCLWHLLRWLWHPTLLRVWSFAGRLWHHQQFEGPPCAGFP